jgi:hypothetical protein
VRARSQLALLCLLLAAPRFEALSQQVSPRLEVSLLAANSPPLGASVRATGMLRDPELLELLRNGFPASMRFRLELWREGGFFDEIESAVQWNVLVRFDPYTQQYLAVRRQGTADMQDFGGFPSIEAVEAAVLAQPHPIPLRPRRDGARYYYNVILDVESLSVSDLDELQRWLRGELQPAVRGKRSPLSALREGFGTLLSRVLGGETRHFESRSATFRA